jgi:glutamyl-Q tRNA(Asp) synthetase
MASDRRARAWRMRVQTPQIELEDGLLGAQRIDLQRETGDFPVYRADGVYSFHLACAVDEAALGITDVVRGADLLDSSARQIYVMSQLRRPAPRYVHLPIAVDAGGTKLSKQTGAPAVDTAQPAATLCAVMRFLNQPIPPALARAPLAQFWAHAIEHWDLSRVRAQRSAPGP